MFTIYNDNILLLNIHACTLYNNTEYSNNINNNNNNEVTYLSQRSLCLITMSLLCLFLTSVF